MKLIFVNRDFDPDTSATSRVVGDVEGEIGSIVKDAGCGMAGARGDDAGLASASCGSGTTARSVTRWEAAPAACWMTTSAGQKRFGSGRT